MAVNLQVDCCWCFYLGVSLHSASAFHCTIFVPGRVVHSYVLLCPRIPLPPLTRLLSVTMVSNNTIYNHQVVQPITVETNWKFIVLTYFNHAVVRVNQLKILIDLWIYETLTYQQYQALKLRTKPKHLGPKALTGLYNVTQEASKGYI